MTPPVEGPKAESARKRDASYRLDPSVCAQLTGDRIVLVGRNDTARSTETIAIARSATGSSITYTNQVQFNGVAKLAAPLAKIVVEKLGDDTEKQLVETLSALQARPPAGGTGPVAAGQP